MKVLVVCLVFICSINYLVNAQRFRFDFTYFKDIDGWLKFHEYPRPWREALLKCSHEGSTLASPRNAAFRTNIFSLMTNNQTANRTYTGISTVFSPAGQFRSLEMIPIEDIPHEWNNESHSNEGCVVMEADGHFTVNNCNEPLQYTCYKNNTNLISTTPCGTNDTEYKLSNDTYSCYKFHKISRTWSEAYKTCSSEGGYLAVINSEAEADFLKQLFAPNNELSGNDWADYAYIGFHNFANNREWTTMQGQTLQDSGYLKFGDGKPYNLWEQEHCGGIGRQAQMHYFECHLTLPFFCEKELNT